MISKKEIQHIASLARLALAEKELKKMEKEFYSILDFINELETVDTKGVAPTSHPIEFKNVTREDNAADSLPEKTDKLIKEIPRKEGRFAKVKAIL